MIEKTTLDQNTMRHQIGWLSLMPTTVDIDDTEIRAACDAGDQQAYTAALVRVIVTLGVEMDRYRREARLTAEHNEKWRSAKITQLLAERQQLHREGRLKTRGRGGIHPLLREEIRRLAANNEITQKELAQEFCVSQATLTRIMRETNG